jgi:hypothetical protein
MIWEMLGALRQRPVLRQLQCGVEEAGTVPLHRHGARLGGNNLKISRAPRQKYTR